MWPIWSRLFVRVFIFFQFEKLVFFLIFFYYFFGNFHWFCPEVHVKEPHHLKVRSKWLQNGYTLIGHNWLKLLRKSQIFVWPGLGHLRSYQVEILTTQIFWRKVVKFSEGYNITLRSYVNSKLGQNCCGIIKTSYGRFSAIFSPIKLKF